MRYVVVGLAFGLAWAAMMVARGDSSEPAVLAVAVLVCGLFGALLWGLRVLVLRWRDRGVR